MKTDRWSIAVSVGALMLVLSYQNCANSGLDQNPYSGSQLESLSCDPTRENCASTSGEVATLTMKVDSLDIIYRNLTYHNVTGTCGGYGFYQIQLVWSMPHIGLAGSVPCDSLGRFLIQVPIPGGFNYNADYTFTLNIQGRATSTSGWLTNSAAQLQMLMRGQRG